MVQRQDQGPQAQTETQEVPCELSYSQSDQALAQFFQKDCGVFHAGDIQKPSEHGPGQAGLDDTAWAEGLDKMIFQS